MNQAQQHLLAKTIAYHCPSASISTVYQWLNNPKEETSTDQEIIAAAKLVCELGQIICPIINNLQSPKAIPKHTA